MNQQRKIIPRWGLSIAAAALFAPWATPAPYSDPPAQSASPELHVYPQTLADFRSAVQKNALSGEFDLGGFPSVLTERQEVTVMTVIGMAQMASGPNAAIVHANAHLQLANYYQRKGDTQRAAAERAKSDALRSGRQMAPVQPSTPAPVAYAAAAMPAPAPPAQPAYPAPQPSAPYGYPAPAPPAAADFDLSGLPPAPTNFKEQQVMAEVNAARNPSASPAVVASAHQRLARYYQESGDSQRAAAEYAKASGGGGQTMPVGADPSVYPAAPPQPAYPAPADPAAMPALPPDPNSVPAPAAYPSLVPPAAPAQPHSKLQKLEEALDVFVEVSRAATAMRANNPPATPAYPAMPNDPASVPAYPPAPMPAPAMPADPNSAQMPPYPPAMPVPAAAASNPQTVQASHQNPNLWALTGLPKPPQATPQEEHIWALIHTAKSPAGKAAAHQALAEYWQAKGDAAKAKREFERAQYWQSEGQ